MGNIIRIDFREVKFTNEHIDYRFNRIRSVIASCLGLSGLKDGIKAFQDTVTDFIINPVNNTVPNVVGLYMQFL